LRAERRRRAAAALAALLLPALAAAQVDSLRLATWNLEWLIAPEEFDRLAARCGGPPPGESRSVPCDLVERGSRRSAADFAKLRDYARRLDADVIALQEVDGPEAARLVFPDYAFCFTRRVHVQNVGFAVRAGLPFRCTDYPELGLPDSRVRWGADLTLFPGTEAQMRLLSVHLKSGCHRDPLTSDWPACATLAEQVPVLEAWIDARARERMPFAVLGDFNRRFADERSRARDRAGRLQAMWPELDDADPPEADLTNATRKRRGARCSPGDGHEVAIDHIVLSRSAAQWLVPGSVQRIAYSGADARRFRLSDHCPVAVTIDLP
jgi:endonuclease/exonuclease/phosphatase family metal-dependent hydrolase